MGLQSMVLVRAECDETSAPEAEASRRTKRDRPIFGKQSATIFVYISRIFFPVASRSFEDIAEYH